MAYPEVIGEFETLKKLRKGFSIARFGDGEVGILSGKGYSREPANEGLTGEITRALHTKQENLLIGIPTMDPKGSRYWNWKRHKDRYEKLWPKGRTYYSAFISRPDCGEWMLTRRYAKAVQKLWLGKTVTVIGSEAGRNKMAKAIELTQEVNFIECPFREAYSALDDLQAQAIDAGSDLTILCHGVSATCLAARLAPYQQTIDLGSIGGFVYKMLTENNYEDELRYGLDNSAKV